MVEVYILLIHKVQLHVSALDSGHLQVVQYMKYLLSSYTKLIWAVYMGQVGGEVDTRSRMCHRG